MNGPEYECDGCKGTGIAGGRTTDDYYEPCPEDHEIEEEE